MKTLKKILAVVAVSSFCLSLVAEDKAAKPKPYPLDTCVVTDEKLDGHGKPYVFTHDGREIKMCCKSCLKDFKKDTAKYIKKLDEADKKAKK